MISDVDEALRTLVRRAALGGSDVEVVLDSPTREWAARRNSPTLALFLYDVRESIDHRLSGLYESRNSDGYVTTREPLARMFRLSYLVTAWTARPEDEHRLLDAVMECFLAFDALPPDTLTGSLADAPVPVRIDLGAPSGESGISDVWSALGGDLKASLDVVVYAPFTLHREVAAGPPVLEEPRLTFDVGSGEAEEAGGRRSRARPHPKAPAPDELADETRTGGTEAQRGRIVRVRATR
jgi:hypothetical protein